MPRTKPADVRRADLLAAGEAVFVAKGVASTTLEDITRAAGVSKGLFYQYFRSKEELVFALQERFATEFADHVRTAIEGRPDWPSRLDAAVQACFDHFQAKDELHEVLFRHGAHGAAGERAVSPSRALVEALAQLLDDGRAAGAFALDDPDATALLLFGAMHAFDPAIRSGGTVSDERLIRGTQALARRAAGVTGPPPG